MAPRPHNDDAALLQIALVLLDKPNATFSAVEREISAGASAYCHSTDSRRRRLCRKFRRDRDYWMREARAYRQREKDEQVRLFFQDISDMCIAVGHAVSRFRDRLGPILDIAVERLSQPETQAAMANVAKAIETMQPARLKTIPRN